ncbi:MAG TPA: PH domain-containing protein [Thermoanaerobaculia bacterium]|nr:PH domain-containing protein [Thermoanaerobaculia bacterium]
MGYAEKNLVPGETILYRARYHWVFYRFSIVVMVLAAVLAVFAYRTKGEQAWNEVGWWLMLVAAAFAVIALASFAMLRFRANLDEFIVTSRRVIRKVGVVSREIQQAPLEKIQDITIEQGVLGRMLGFGTVIVETASEKGMIVFPSVAGPEGFRNHIWGQPPSRGDAPVPAAPPAQARLEELENLKQRGLVSPEEYAAKRQEILSHL